MFGCCTIFCLCCATCDAIMNSGETPRAAAEAPSGKPPAGPRLPSMARGVRNFRLGTSSKQDFVLLDGRLFGPSLPADAAAVRIVRVGGGSTLRRLGRTLGRGEDQTRELDAVPTCELASQQSPPTSQGGVLATWTGPVLILSKTIHAGGNKEAVVNFQLQYTTTSPVAEALIGRGPPVESAAATGPPGAHLPAAATPPPQVSEWKVMPGLTADASLDLVKYMSSRESAPAGADLTWPTRIVSIASGNGEASAYILKVHVAHVASDGGPTALQRFLRARSGLRLTFGMQIREPDSPLSATRTASNHSCSQGRCRNQQLPSRSSSARSDVTAASLPPLETEYSDRGERPPEREAPGSTSRQTVSALQPDGSATATVATMMDGTVFNGAAAAAGTSASGVSGPSPSDVPGSGATAAGGARAGSKCGRLGLPALDSSQVVDQVRDVSPEGQGEMEEAAIRNGGQGPKAPAAAEVDAMPVAAKVSPDAMLKVLQQISQPPPLPPGHAAPLHPASIAAAEAVAAMAAAAAVAAGKFRNATGLPSCSSEMSASATPRDIEKRDSKLGPHVDSTPVTAAAGASGNILSSSGTDRFLLPSAKLAAVEAGRTQPLSVLENPDVDSAHGDTADSSPEVDLEIAPQDYPIVGSLELSPAPRLCTEDVGAVAAVEALQAARQAATTTLGLAALVRSASGRLDGATGWAGGAASHAAATTARGSPYSSGSASAPINALVSPRGSGPPHVVEDAAGSMFNDLVPPPLAPGSASASGGRWCGSAALGNGRGKAPVVVAISKAGPKGTLTHGTSGDSAPPDGFSAGERGLWILHGGSAAGVAPGTFRHMLVQPKKLAAVPAAAVMGPQVAEVRDGGGNGGGGHFASVDAGTTDSGASSKVTNSAAGTSLGPVVADNDVGRSGQGLTGGEHGTWAFRRPSVSNTNSGIHSRDAASYCEVSSDLIIRPSGEVTGVLDLHPTAAVGPHGSSSQTLQPQLTPPQLSVHDLYDRGVTDSPTVLPISPTNPVSNSNGGGGSGGSGGDGGDGDGGGEAAVARAGFELMSALLSGDPEAISRAAAFKLGAEAEAAAVAEAVGGAPIGVGMGWEQPSPGDPKRAGLTGSVVRSAVGGNRRDSAAASTAGDKGLSRRTMSEPSAADAVALGRVRSLPTPALSRLSVARPRKLIRRQSNPIPRPLTFLAPVPEGSESKEEIAPLPPHFFSPLSSPSHDDANCGTFFSEPAFIYAAGSLLEPDAGGGRLHVISGEAREVIQQPQQQQQWQLQYQPAASDASAAAASTALSGAAGDPTGSAGRNTTEAEQILRLTLLPAAMHHTEQWVAAHRSVPLREMAVLQARYAEVEAGAVPEAEEDETAAQAGSSRESEEAAETELDELLAEGAELLTSGVLESGMEGEQEAVAAEEEANEAEEEEQEGGGKEQKVCAHAYGAAATGEVVSSEVSGGGPAVAGVVAGIGARERTDDDSAGGGGCANASGNVDDDEGNDIASGRAEVPWAVLEARADLQPLNELCSRPHGMAPTSGGTCTFSTDPRVSDAFINLPSVTATDRPNYAAGESGAESFVPRGRGSDPGIDPAPSSPGLGTASTSAVLVPKLQTESRGIHDTADGGAACGNSSSTGGGRTRRYATAADEPSGQPLDVDLDELWSQRAFSLEVLPGRSLSAGAQLAAAVAQAPTMLQAFSGRTLDSRTASAICSAPGGISRYLSGTGARLQRSLSGGDGGGMEAAVLPMSPLQASGGSGGSGVPALSPEVASALAAAVLRSREINTGCEERAGASAPAALRQRRHSIVRTGWLGWWPLALAEKALVVGAASAVSVASELLEGVSHLQPPAPYGPEEGLITVPLLRPYATLWAHLPWPIAPVAHTGWWMLVGLTCGMLAAVDTMRGLLGLPGLIPIP